MYTQINKCRICGNTNLELVLDLGEQMLTGVFPKEKDENITSGPLRLVKCSGEDSCGLLQLEHSYSLDEMYGENYGYRSGLNSHMVKHLHAKVKKILGIVNLAKGDLVLDIGSNDSTTLQAYPKDLAILVGIDPTGVKFKEYYPEHISLIPDFFSAQLLKDKFPDKKAKIVTSFSMFYDLESPMDFMKQVFDVLSDDGVWVFEQSYMPTMLAMNSYDTACHEHLEYYSLRQINWMAKHVGFDIIDVEFNDINGGSFSVMVRKSMGEQNNCELANEILKREEEEGLNTLEPYREFSKRIEIAKKELLEFVDKVKSEGKTIYGLGASTKGNVLLQYCNLNADKLGYIGEVNPDKYGSFTPGTWIPIISEDELLNMKPDYLIILPWHFKKFFIENKKFSGVKLVSPLPNVEVIS